MSFARLSILVVLSLAAGCAAHHSHVESVDSSRDSTGDTTWPVIVEGEPCEPEPRDFGMDASVFTANGIRWLDEKPTSGRFPTGIAVASITTCRDIDEKQSRRIVPRRLPVEQAAQWNQVLDGLSPVREVTFFDAGGTTPDAKTLPQIVREAGELKCSYCLVFASWGDGISEQRIMGVLYETQPMRPVAAISTAASVPPAVYQFGLKQKPQDERLYRADYRAMRKFHAEAYRAAAALLNRDEPAAATQQSPWQTDRPLFPRDPRRRYGEPEYP